MRKLPFTPPPPIDHETNEKMKKTVERMTETDWALADYKVKNDPYIQDKYIKPLKNREKSDRKQRRREWWWNKGIPLINLFLALVAAITGIIALLR